MQRLAVQHRPYSHGSRRGDWRTLPESPGFKINIAPFERGCFISPEASQREQKQIVADIVTGPSHRHHGPVPSSKLMVRYHIVPSLLPIPALGSGQLTDWIGGQDGSAINCLVVLCGEIQEQPKNRQDSIGRGSPYTGSQLFVASHHHLLGDFRNRTARPLVKMKPYRLAIAHNGAPSEASGFHICIQNLTQGGRSLGALRPPSHNRRKDLEGFLQA